MEASIEDISVSGTYIFHLKDPKEPKLFSVTLLGIEGNIYHFQNTENLNHYIDAGADRYYDLWAIKLTY